MTALLLLALFAQFRVTVEEVLVDVVVTRGDEPVRGLVAADFELLDEGVARPVRIVPLDDLSLSVLFVMDLSLSVTPERRERLRSAAERVARQLDPGDVCAASAFAGTFALIHDFAPCASLPEDVFGGVETGGGTALWDSLATAISLADAAPGRSVILLFSDGADTVSWLPEPLVEETLRTSDALIHALIPPDARGRARARPRGRVTTIPPSVQRRARIGIRRMGAGPAPDSLATLLPARSQGFRSRLGQHAPSELQLLRRVTELSGGRMITVREEDGVLVAYEEILRDLESRYVLAFSPDPAQAPGWRRLEVTTTAEGAEVRARRGWFHGATR